MATADQVEALPPGTGKTMTAAALAAAVTGQLDVTSDGPGKGAA